MTGRRASLGGVWALAFALFALSAALAPVALATDTVRGPIRMPWWAIAVLVTIAELSVVHLQFRKDAHSFSMSEIPLLLGLFFASPVALLVGSVVGNAVAFGLLRKQPPVKIAFNLGSFTLQTILAIVVFRALAGYGTTPGNRDWAAAYASVLLVTIVAFIAVNLAIRLSGGRLTRREMLDVVTFSLLASTMNAGLGAVAVSILWSAPSQAWLAVVPPVVLFVAYRAYVGQRQERSRLESLYEATRALHESPQVEDALRRATCHGLSVFEAERVEIVLFPREVGEPAYRTVAAMGSEPIVMEPGPMDDTALTWAAALAAGTAVRLGDAHAGGETILAPIVEHGEVVGAMAAVDRLGDIGGFGRNDIRLLETIARSVSVSIENGRLEDSLAEVTRLKEELHHRSLHDVLTGLANRALFGNEVEAALEGLRPHETVAVLFLDLDDFKTVNDSLGHAAGDRLLVAAARRLREACRPEDLVARLGGDEFAILLTDVRQPEDAATVAQRLVDALERPFSLEHREIRMHASIGIAFGRRGDTAGGLLRNADAAMYAAKRTRKGTFQVYDSSMHAEVIRRLELRAALVDAVQGHELELLYQPVIDLETGRIAGVEALVRWQHPERGLVAPDDFIPFAEDSGLIVPLGRWVMREATRQASIWRERFPDLSVAINVSPRQLLDPTLERAIADALDEWGLEPSALILEITENVLMHTSVGVLERLKALGVRVAIDDFGTGYSSLSYLDRLPIDIVKIDRSFVERLADPEASPLVTAILQIGDTLGLATVVEGIETAQQLERVRSLGCRFGQGYYFSTPQPPGVVETLLGLDGVEPLLSSNLPQPRLQIVS